MGKLENLLVPGSLYHSRCLIWIPRIKVIYNGCHIERPSVRFTPLVKFVGNAFLHKRHILYWETKCLEYWDA